MSIHSRLSRCIAAGLLVASISTLTLADTVRLKDGSIIKGKIVSFSGGKFVVAMGEGSRRRELTFAAAEVESIVFDNVVPATTGGRNASYDKPDDMLPNPPSRPVDTVPANQPRNTTPSNQPRNTGIANQPANSSKLEPISWQIKVLGDNTANGWTNTGWVVKKGQRIHISGDGRISIGPGRSTGPAGLTSVDDPQRLLKNVATGALIAVIGDDNNDFIYIGADREITATRDGALFLGINEGNLDDNSGFFNVRVEVLPDTTD